ncbi:MAG: KpsF/GutQ family sugar-phosphate isomerase [Bacteroidales bacterium]
MAIQTIKAEAMAINGLVPQIDDNFTLAIQAILACKGRVVITGVGKSAIIASKIVATLNSTGTPAIFMHAADAIHGDLGMVQKDDVVMCISNSGNTPEIKVLTPMLKALGASLIGMVGNLESYLARQADLVVNATVENEAITGNPAPTTSTTAQLVMGDAIAVTLLRCRGFTVEDFARYHPGGALGKQLYLKAADLYIKNQKPQVNTADDLRTVILEISGKRLGATAVMEGNRLAGIVTDGDLRRMLESNKDVSALLAKDIMSENPRTISPNTLAVDALNQMRKSNITQLLVVEDGEYLGVVHLHDILNEGII